VAIDVGLCDRCNPLGLRDSSASQVHGIAVAGVIAFVVFMAVVARFALAGVGPFDGAVTNVVPVGNALSITLAVTNKGTNGGQTTCRISDPADRTGNLGGFMLSPQIGPGASVTFTQRITVLGATVRPLVADCKSP
jgi:hypothetical protein